MKTKEKIYSIATFLLILDQFIKLLIKTKLHLGNTITIIPNFFSIYYCENDGAAFSILRGKTYAFIIVSFLVLFLLDRYLSKEINFSKLSVISLALIIGGILGNLLDRLLYSKVIDYLAFTIFSYSAPIFNIADICITIGAILLVISFFKEEINVGKHKK